MPYVNIKLAGDKTSAEQKQKIIEGVTEVLAKTLDKSPDRILISIDQASTDNWGRAGKTLTELLQSQ